jgi:hypothetical protein
MAPPAVASLVQVTYVNAAVTFHFRLVLSAQHQDVYFIAGPDCCLRFTNYARIRVVVSVGHHQNGRLRLSVLAHDKTFVPSVFIK